MKRFTISSLGGRWWILDPNGYTILSCHSEQAALWTVKMLNKHIDEYVHPLDKMK